MAGSEKDSIMDLLRPFVKTEVNLLRMSQKLGDVSVHLLLSLPADKLDLLITEVFPAASLEEKFALHAAIQSRKENRTHEGEPVSKKAKSLPDVLGEVVAESSYYEKLLEPPAELPRSVDQLKEFLSLRPAKLPVIRYASYLTIHEPGLVMFDTTPVAQSLAIFCENAFKLMDSPCPDNEATSSAELWYLTGEFLRFLNDKAPENRVLQSFRFRLDSANRTTSSVASKSVQPLLRPDFQLFVKSCLILRWENKIDETLRAAAVAENTSKLKAWSPLFYGKLPYVIGGCCAGRQFQWLKLFPKGSEIAVEYISDAYDLNTLGGVAKFLHSIIRMHCLLQKLQEKIDCAICLALYVPKERSGGGVVTVYPDRVEKKLPGLDRAKWTVLNSLYDSIAGSRYLIQLKSYRRTGNGTIMHLQPVGEPFARPDNLGDLRNAIHDMLNGLADLHGKGYTHRDLRWDNCIKVNDESDWKWVIIDLEAGGPDNEVWVAKGLTDWDAETLEEDHDKKKRYTKGSDMYQLGKLIAEWLDIHSEGGKEERQVMRHSANKLQQERTAAVKVLKIFCKKGCKRCRMFGTKL